MPLPPLPGQPEKTLWPTVQWPCADPDGAPGLGAVVDAAFAAGPADPLGVTKALLVVHRGRLVVERYADGVSPASTLPSWSIAKSVLDALVGLLVRDGLVSLDDRLSRPEWSRDDPRRNITIADALEMRTGLAWNEDYVDLDHSDVVAMLYREGKADMAAYVAARPLAHEPGTTYGYSSGTSNLLSAHLGSVLAGAGTTVGEYLHRELFEPLGMDSVILKHDGAGTWIASTYAFATAADFARFGLLYLRDGVWDGRRVLPEGWVDATRRPQPDVDDDGWGYGRHWWTLPAAPGLFFANGHLGQYVLLVPQLDLLIVRLGETTADPAHPVLELLLDLVAAFDPDVARHRT